MFTSRHAATTSFWRPSTSFPSCSRSVPRWVQSTQSILMQQGNDNHQICLLLRVEGVLSRHHVAGDAAAVSTVPDGSHSLVNLPHAPPPDCCLQLLKPHLGVILPGTPPANSTTTKPQPTPALCRQLRRTCARRCTAHSHGADASNANNPNAFFLPTFIPPSSNLLKQPSQTHQPF